MALTIYEQIQKTINFIEDNLSNRLRSEDVAGEANMSVRSFYNYFWAISGYNFKQYVIKRRLAESLTLLKSDLLQVVDVAFESGYESHESFTRAFKNEFGVTPVDYKKKPCNFTGVSKLKLVNEMYMGVIVKKLHNMKALAFEGFAPDPEEKARKQMDEWFESKDLNNLHRRIFGHNIDLEGNLDNNPDNVGYKFLVTVSDNLILSNDSVKTDIIKAGKFVVTGIEGSLHSDANGKWITEGWQKLHTMIEKKGYKVKSPCRWFEEELEPSKQGNLRLDLYLEIE